MSHSGFLPLRLHFFYIAAISLSLHLIAIHPCAEPRNVLVLNGFFALDFFFFWITVSPLPFFPDPSVSVTLRIFAESQHILVFHHYREHPQYQ